jgi:hypothetical protein
VLAVSCRASDSAKHICKTGRIILLPAASITFRTTNNPAEFAAAAAAFPDIVESDAITGIIASIYPRISSRKSFAI